MSKMTMPFGDGSSTASVPPSFEVEDVLPPEIEVRPLEGAAREALSHPLASPPLRELARGRTNAVVCVPDASRPQSPAAPLVLLLEELRAGGIPPDHVTVAVGLGLHARPDKAALAAHVGLPNLCGARVVAHDPGGEMADLGTGPKGVPIRVSRLLTKSDLLLAFGWVEPHQYAGFSGGFKTAVIGCGSEETIGATHSPVFIDHPLCRPGSLDGNPFQELLALAGRRAGLVFVLNAIPRKGGAAAAAAGEPSAVLRELAGRARDAYAVYSGHPADAAVTGVKAPKDRNLYQASRAVTNLVCGARSAIREGGAIVLLAGLADGCGEGAGEKRFENLMREGVPAILARDETTTFRGGEQRAWMVAKVLEGRTVILAGTQSPERFEGLPFHVVSDLERALAEAAAITGGGRLLRVPDAIGTFTAP